MSSGYIGRFAPSPTGPLHFGSLIAALASFLDARAHGGRWLVRMEDIDPPREMPGGAEAILRQLQQHGLFWDGEVVYQSTRADRYLEILDGLFERQRAYFCNCSRRRVTAMGGVYDGHCVGRRDVPIDDSAVRVQLPRDTVVSFEDRLQGRQQQNLSDEVGDFIVRRRDGLFAYQLAVVVDDLDQGITDVVRGIDLMASTARQIWLMRQLGATIPSYSHLPVAVNRFHQKLSKQHHATTLDRLPAISNLKLALSWLGFTDIAGCDRAEPLLAKAVADWPAIDLKGVTRKPAPNDYL
jgi:glutamyl-Q tRNA(Asp) synthetase